MSKFCNKCGKELSDDAKACPSCGTSFVANEQKQSPVIVNVENHNSNVNAAPNGTAKNKWVAFFLCWFLGCFGAHKFYEGKVGMGILYLLTGGLIGIGWIIDWFVLLFKPNPYYV